MTRAQAAKPIVELKGRMMTLTVLRLLNSSVEVLARELDKRVLEAPDFFRHLPVILDVEAVASSDLYLDLPGLAGLLQARQFVPVGIRGGDERWVEAAASAGLAIFPAERKTPADKRGNADAEVEQQPQAAMVVTQPVRSGQQIYARGGDLVILTSVSPGAEVLADGHIHIYGALNGRALAGVKGDTAARIFCQCLRAELVSIAGTYSINEQFDRELVGRSVQVSLHGEGLHIERL